MRAAIAIVDGIRRFLIHAGRPHDVLSVLPFNVGGQHFSVKQLSNLVKILQATIATRVPIICDAVAKGTGTPRASNFFFEGVTRFSASSSGSNLIAHLSDRAEYCNRSRKRSLAVCEIYDVL